MSDIERFAIRYQLDEASLVDQPSGQAALAVDLAGRIGDDVPIEAIRIDGYGRFGNTLFSFLDALLVARALRVKSIEICRLEIELEIPSLLIDDIQFTPNTNVIIERPTLVGQFFHPEGLERLIGHYDTSVLMDLLVQYCSRLYAPLLDRAGSLGPKVIVLHFRGGDVFGPGGSHPEYVQPPASYYMKSIDYACRNLGVESVCMVFEDRTNPAVDLVAKQLDHLGITVTYQSASIVEDLVTILSAHHLVAPHGTFCEAAAMLSPVLETFTSFRKLPSQKNISFWSQSKVAEILRLRRVRTFVVDDPDKSYTAANSWGRTAEQLRIITSYDGRRLRHMETSR